jgi:hypothetical protein
MQVKASLRALLSDVIDYAGMFPPAQLDLDAAIRNYARYRSQPEAWMLGRFICRAEQLADLDAYASLFAEQPLRLSVLAGTAPLERDLCSPEQFDLTREWARVEAQEVRVPPGGLDPSAVNEMGGGRRVFIECALSERWQDDVSQAVTSLVSAPECRFGFKLRCGGADASAVPSAEQVAFVISKCRDAGVPLKLTAGLHHPFRHVDPGLQCHVHGFVNLFVAGVLTWSLQLDPPDIQAIVEEEDPRQFRFEDDLLVWNEAQALLDEIEDARRDRVISFGSCSFDEPREDLRRFDLLGD